MVPLMLKSTPARRRATAAEAATKHPLAGTTMNGADMIVQVLADEGVDTIFGYSGGAILPTYDAIHRYNSAHAKSEEIRLIVPANEQGAGFMAAGYARSTGKVGVFLVTSGPGATNSVTPIRDSFADSVPVVLICGQVPRAAIGTDAFQEAPVFNIMSACAERFRIPVVTTVMGLGAVDTTSDLSLHMLGMHGQAYANYAVEDADFVFAVGARFDDRVCAKPLEWAPQARVAHLDIDGSEIRKVKKTIDWNHV